VPSSSLPLPGSHSAPPSPQIIREEYLEETFSVRLDIFRAAAHIQLEGKHEEILKIFRGGAVKGDSDELAELKLQHEREARISARQEEQTRLEAQLAAMAREGEGMGVLQDEITALRADKAQLQRVIEQEAETYKTRMDRTLQQLEEMESLRAEIVRPPLEPWKRHCDDALGFNPPLNLIWDGQVTRGGGPPHHHDCDRAGHSGVPAD
jgi:hypothetical protein